MSKKEEFYKAEFLMDENRKITVKSKIESLPLYILSVTKNKDFKENVSVAEVVTSGIAAYVTDEKYRPTVENPVIVYVNSHGRDGIKDFTFFGFYEYITSTLISTAVFEDELKEIPDFAKENIRCKDVENT